MINEAVTALAEGVASAEDIDTGMRLGANFPMGPLALATSSASTPRRRSSPRLYRDIGDAKYAPCALLDEYIADGKLGRKSGAGFYTTPERGGRRPGPRGHAGAPDERRAMTAEREGFVQVYTGDGKGKTTAALGLALRALATTCASPCCSS